MVNILVVGSGGREHALSWKLSQSNKVETVYTAPGNGGTENNIPIDVTDLDGLAEFAQKNNCFTVVGPEDPLASGIVDKFNKLNLKVFGPSQAAAQLESSKIWAKNFMKRNLQRKVMTKGYWTDSRKGKTRDSQNEREIFLGRKKYR